MYSFQLNIGSLTTPVIGGGWVDITPSEGNASLNKEVEGGEVYARIKLDGALKLMGGDFTAVDTLRADYAKCDIRVRITTGGITETIYTGNLDLRGEYLENVCTLKVSSDDEYTDLLVGKSKKVNILNASPSIKCDVTTEYSTLYFALTSISQSSQWYTSDGNIPNVWAREEIRLADHLADALDGTGQWAIISTNADGTKTLARPWDALPFDTAVSGDFNITTPYTQTRTINDQVSIGSKQYTYIDSNDTDPNPANWFDVLLDNDKYYAPTAITYSRFRYLKDVIETIVTEFDSSIQFDDDSWTYLDDNDDLKYLLIANVSDLIPSGGIEKTTGQEFGYMTFDKLMEMLKEKLKLYWRLETSGGTTYFRLKHRSEVSYSTGTLDLTNYHGFNWAERDKWEYTDIDKFNRYEREVEAGNIDFLGTDILVPALDNIAEPKTVGDEKWYFDVWDIISRGSDIYPADKDDEFCMISAEPIATDEVDLLTNMTNSGTYPFETFSYSSGTLTAANTTGSAAVCTSNTFTTIKGYLYKVTLNRTAHTGADFILKSAYIDFGNPIVASGSNDYYGVALSDSSSATIRLETGISSVTIEDMAIVREIFNCRVSVGALSGISYANADLSVANLDAGHAQYELPDVDCTINLQSVTLSSTQLIKDKEQVLFAPIHNPNDVDEEELFTTNKGALEFKSLRIPLSGAMPEITGRFV